LSGIAVIAPAFSLVDVPAEHREFITKAGRKIEGYAYCAVCDYVRIGLILAEAKARVRGRTFRRWVAAELPMSRAWAYQLIKVGQAFGPFIRPDADEVFDAKALVLLASAPPAAVAYALEQAGDGKKVTVEDAREIVAAHRPQPDPTREQVKAHDKTMKPIRDAEKAARAAAAAAAGDPLRAARAWAMIEKLAGLGGPVVVSTVADDGDDEEDDPPPFLVVAHVPGDLRRAVRRSLVDAVAACLGEEEDRECPRCKVTKPVGEFGANASKPRRLNTYCKTCERKRLRRFKKAAKAKVRRAARAAGAAARTPST
jgi:hypothetical protein